MVFDTSQNKTLLVAVDPALHWKGGVLPDDEPQNSDGRQRAVWRWCGPGGNLLVSGLFHYRPAWCRCVLVCPPGLNIQDVIMIVLSVSVVVVTAIALLFYR